MAVLDVEDIEARMSSAPLSEAALLIGRDLPALIKEVRDLRAALRFKAGIIDDLSATVERLEAAQ